MSKRTAQAVRVIVDVHKLPTNEVEPWVPPTAREVASFIQEKLAGVETDEGWKIGMVIGEYATPPDRDRAPGIRDAAMNPKRRP